MNVLKITGSSHNIDIIKTEMNTGKKQDHKSSGGESMKTSKLSRGQKLFCLLLFIPCIYTGKGLDNDIWFLLNSGKYVFQHGIPHIEPFTIHEGMSFVMQQWLSAGAFWKIYDFFGETGLVLFVVVFYILFVYSALKLSMMLSDSNFEVSFAVTLLVSCTMNIFMVERPHIFLFIIILLELYFLEKYISKNKILFLIPLPIMSILLVNLEAAMWPFLFVILIPYLIDSFKFRFNIESHGYDKKGILIVSLTMLIAGIINPYGIDAMTYLFNSYGIIEINTWIQEMKCADINSVLGKIIIGSIFLSFFLICIFWKKGNHRLRFHLLFLGTAYLALSSVRSFSLFIICGIIPMSFYFKNFKPKIKYKNDKKTLLIRRILIIFLVAATARLVILNNRNDTNTNHQDLISNVDYLEQRTGKNIKLYTGYNDGGYLEFRGFKVYMDGRAEVFLKSNNKKQDIFKEYYDLQNGDVYYRDVLNEYNFDYILVGDNDILYNYLDYDKDYKLIHSSIHYKIFEHLE